MKKLTKIRLINWHYFANETINVKNNTLITGQNATGKSTIIDAVAFIITAGDQIFNLAANEKSKRDLRGYVKCKLGINDKEYLREGDTTGHVALEFYDETKQEYFVVGSVIDIFGEVLPPKVIFYQIKGNLKDEYFIDEENRIRTTVMFKKTKKATKVYLTRREAKLAFRSLFGSINENYFSLIPKALAFKPIPDVKNFIYKYLLEEKVLDVDSIKESINAYRDLEATLKVIKKKVTDLQDIKAIYEEIKTNEGQKEFYEYFMKLLDVQSMKAEIEKYNVKLDKVKVSKEQNAKLIEEINTQLQVLDERSKEIYSMLQSNSSFSLSQVYDKEIQELDKSIAKKEEIKQYARKKFRKAKQIIEELRTEYKKPSYNSLTKIELTKINEENYEDNKLKLLKAKKELDQILDENKSELGKQNHIKNGLVKRINSVYQTLKDLENHKIRYNPMVKNLQSQIVAGVKQRYGVDINVHLLCELLEVTNPDWHDTVEDYLGFQRFNLIVEPRYFDEALNVYNQVKDSLKIYGIGLVNTKKIQHFKQFRDKSLASIISSENVDARHFINMICGNLIMVDDVSDLENYPQAITNSGMVYRSYTVRSLNKNQEKPFIGKKAGEKQLEKWRNLANNTRIEFNRVNDGIQILEEENNAINALNISEIISLQESYYSINSLKERRKELLKKKSQLPEESLTEIRAEYENIKEEIRGYETNRQKAYERNGKLNSDELKFHEAILDIEKKLKRLTNKIAFIGSENLTLEKEAENLYKHEISKSNNIPKIVEEYQSRIQRELETIDNLEDSLKTKQFKYVNTYNLSYQFGKDNMYEYIDELNKLVKSELVKYESKVREARESAEKLFKEDFIAKLRDYIISAQDEISRINQTLANIHFGEDTYEFIFPKSKEYGEYYDMVLSDESLKAGTEMLNYDFEMKYQKQLEELFVNLASEDLNAPGVVNKFTDYRTYMDYDILIKNTQGESILYSKVFKEKSGGETQVPFYVATLASFVRLFEQAKSGRIHDTIGLIIFDEVFDKMDTSRIKSMMEFIRQLPVQIILATPPQKMEVLSKYTDTTVVTLREGRNARAYEAIKSMY
ncbi:ATP-binding protein [Candidatus Izemoplasma sp. B36]|uniref:ATP-binding protein n=1 Tax=Candidatus Izemoplasma sp. B36 TaxID=3242468 RepID=UPI003555C4A3